MICIKKFEGTKGGEDHTYHVGDLITDEDSEEMNLLQKPDIACKEGRNETKQTKVVHSEV